MASVNDKSTLRATQGVQSLDRDASQSDDEDTLSELDIVSSHTATTDALDTFQHAAPDEHASPPSRSATLSPPPSDINPIVKHHAATSSPDSVTPMDHDGPSPHYPVTDLPESEPEAEPQSFPQAVSPMVVESWRQEVDEVEHEEEEAEAEEERQEGLDPHCLSSPTQKDADISFSVPSVHISADVDVSSHQVVHSGRSRSVTPLGQYAYFSPRYSITQRIAQRASLDWTSGVLLQFCQT